MVRFELTGASMNVTAPDFVGTVEKKDRAGFCRHGQKKDRAEESWHGLYMMFYMKTAPFGSGPITEKQPGPT